MAIAQFDLKNMDSLIEEAQKVNISWMPQQEDFQKIAAWGLDKDPFAAISDYSELKKELRWLNPGHRKCYDAYLYARLQYMEFTKTYKDYYRNAKKPVDRLRWEYLMARKAWYIMPLGWKNFASRNARILDVGCGDGDTLQRVIRYVETAWQRDNVTDRKLHVTGVDLNASRIENAKRLVRTTHPNVTVEFTQGDLEAGLDYPDQHFDYSLATGVLEIIEDGAPLKAFLDEICRLTKVGFFSEELVDKFPGGVPRIDLDRSLVRRGFDVKNFHMILSEPFDLHAVQDPMKLWPVMLIQDLYAERV